MSSYELVLIRSSHKSYRTCFKNLTRSIVKYVIRVYASLKTDLCFATLKFAGGIERRNVGLTKMLSKGHSAHFAFCNN